MRAQLLNSPAGSLVPALAVSVALHVAVLAGVPPLWTFSTDAARAPLNARLEPPAESRGVPVEPAAAVTREPAPQTKGATRPVRTSRPEVAPRVEVAAKTVTPEASPVQPESQPVAPAAPGARAEAELALGEPTLAPRAGPDAIDPGSLAHYRLALIGAAKRHKLYPAYAVERGLQGRVGVRLAVGADGALVHADVRGSSGHAVLDREAVEMLKKAMALTPIPPALRSREFTIDVPVLFELQAG